VASRRSAEPDRRTLCPRRTALTAVFSSIPARGAEIAAVNFSLEI
jgi:hypothetical protein